MDTLKIATRASPLAMWQSEYVKKLLLLSNPSLNIELIRVTTSGDKYLGSLSISGGKGLFVKELEQALIGKVADLAVHSMKDLPYSSPGDLEIVAILEREDPRDTLVTKEGISFCDLSPGSLIGTSSLRRKSQLLAIRPDIICKDLRGNVGTRIESLRENKFSAIVLASAGLRRLGLLTDNCFQFDVGEVLPAIGQGAIGVQALVGNNNVRKLLSPLQCDISSASVKAERKMSAVLGGDCASPIAGYARLEDKEFVMDGLVSDLEGKTVLRVRSVGQLSDPEALGEQVGCSLLIKGANKLLGGN